ncbi:helix-turn-helix domain-containing protein [Cuneatibacter sp. NSJ-177]|uniref:helix-turn-helix domain-containing protein n=1 Tax=Cuneatibacter sp. NSJ-177 TaxID=2931401 RepID=UPI001FD10452|nr:helix-turn-helix transcriptional regulator [Cuneatibacter sp. NSJ-177]MCJ7836847.1 helix-turn-helix domain-containing protein [Cuneatibacter sp. NSJ-177]
MLLERLKTLRRKVNLSQQDLARDIHISREAYSMYENGHRQPPYETLVSLAQYYKVSVDYLLGLTDQPSPALTLTEEEFKLLSEFRALDKRGKDATLAVLHFEYHHYLVQKKAAQAKKKTVKKEDPDILNSL